MVKKEYNKECKKNTYGLQMKRLKDQNDDYAEEAFSGCLTTVLRPMSDVQKCRLEVYHTFPDREILAMRVAEEVNLRGNNVVTSRSDLHDFKCTGPRFSVIARQSERLGWHVSVASIRECDEFGASTVVEDVDAELEKITSPFRTKWIVPLILPIILETPSISNKNLRQALSAYGKEHLLTDSISHDLARGKNLGQSSTLWCRRGECEVY